MRTMSDRAAWWLFVLVALVLTMLICWADWIVFKWLVRMALL